VFRFGADWGFSIDPTVLVRCYLDGRTLYVDHEAYMVGCEIDNTPALFDSVPGSPALPDHRRQRPARDRQLHAAAGLQDRLGDQGPGSLEDGVEFLKVLRHRGASALQARDGR
jgi:phage terminase large subunit